MSRSAAALALLGLATCNSVGAGPAEAPQRPNIVFIFSDDHSAAAISAYGSRINNTPHLARLASRLKRRPPIQQCVVEIQ